AAVPFSLERESSWGTKCVPCCARRKRNLRPREPTERKSVLVLARKLPIPIFEIAFLFSAGALLPAQIRAVVPPQMSPDQARLSSPAVDAGDYVYIGGQGPRRRDGSSPAEFGEQVRQSLNNLKEIVEAAGLNLDHVVYTQVYLEDMSKYAEMNRVFGEY